VNLPGVRFIEIPYYHGAADFLRVAIPVWKAIRRATNENGTFILRLPGLIGTLAGNRLMSSGKGYAVELVGDLEAVLDSGVGGAFAPLYKRYFVPATKRLCANAIAISYITAKYLQEKYPPGDPGRAWRYPSVDLSKFLPGASPRPPSDQQTTRVLTAGSLEQRYKGVDVLLRSLALLRDRGVTIEAHIAGDGIYRAELEGLRNKLGLSESVGFLGWISTERLIAELDAADIFVLASRTEGLPRAILEAMARGVPVVGTRVGGIPEMLSQDCVVPPDDVEALAGAIGRLAADPAARAALSERNIEVAKAYGDTDIAETRRAFYKRLADSQARHA
jgi:phosphatidylinositol alpha-1,6-mannosyltransferase